MLNAGGPAAIMEPIDSSRSDALSVANGSLLIGFVLGVVGHRAGRDHRSLVAGTAWWLRPGGVEPYLRPTFGVALLVGRGGDVVGQDRVVAALEDLVRELGD